MILLLVACAAPPLDAGTADTAADTGDDGAFVVTPAVAALAPEDVDAAVRSMLATEMYLPLDVYVWFGGVLADMVDGTGTCPVPRSADETFASGYSGSCTGDRYSVTGDWQLDVTRVKTEDSVRLRASELYSFRGEVRGDGGEVIAGGNATILWMANRHSATFDMSFGGSFTDPSDVVLASNLSAGYRLEGTYGVDRGLAGALSGGLAGDEVSLGFDGLEFRADCAAPYGSFSIRDPSSGWWTVTLPDDCSGCGTLSWYGEDRGTSCVAADLEAAFVARIQHFLEVAP